MDCRIIEGKKYCKINGSWIKMDEEFNYKEGKRERAIEVNSPTRTKRGVC